MRQGSCRYGWGGGFWPTAPGPVLAVAVEVAVAVLVGVAVAVLVGVLVGDVLFVGVAELLGVACCGCTKTVIWVLVGSTVPADGLWK